MGNEYLSLKQQDLSSPWRPASELAILRCRADLLARIRDFFVRLDVLEVETPVLSRGGNPDIYIESFSSRTITTEGEQTLYLQTSPEFAMKRLLAAGSGSIYQICKAFRQGEQGRYHNPEFTMLEWYRQDFDHHQLMQEVEALLVFLDLIEPGTSINKISYQSLFEQHVGVNPHLISNNELINCIHEQAIPLHHGHISQLDKDDLLALILTHVIEPAISHDGFVLVYDYPASQASLARLSDGPVPVAERFELYADGIELANGFNELTDAEEQSRRFQHDCDLRERRGQQNISLDHRFIDALRAGLPPCAGVALGFDRLLMLATKSKSLQEVMPFPINQA